MLRAELDVEYLMRHIVPCDERMPFLPWFRPEWGESGNPHIHGLVYVADNPNFEAVVKDEATKAELLEGVGGVDGDVRTWLECENELADFLGRT